jgi:hypothetical protein
MAKLAPFLMLAALCALAFAATPASAAAQLPTGCVGTGVGDHDGDGVPEASGSCTTPPCGCNCPVVGAGVELVALGQDAAATVLLGCGYYLGYDLDPNDVDWDGPVSVDPTVYCYGGGLTNLCSVSISTGGL